MYMLIQKTIFNHFDRNISELYPTPSSHDEQNDRAIPFLGDPGPQQWQLCQVIGIVDYFSKGLQTSKLS